MANSPRNQGHRTDKSVSPVLLISLKALALLGAFIFLLTFFRAGILQELDQKNVRGWGVGSADFGAAFGFPAALFTALAFLGLLATILLQLKELSATRESLRLQEIQTNKFIEQSDEQVRQDRFFKILETIRKNGERRIETMNDEVRYRLEKLELQIRATLVSASQDALSDAQVREHILRFRDSELY